MGVSRRGFLAAISGAAAALLFGISRLSATSARPRSPHLDADGSRGTIAIYLRTGYVALYQHDDLLADGPRLIGTVNEHGLPGLAGLGEGLYHVRVF